MDKGNNQTLIDKKRDAGELIEDILKKIPPERKREALLVLKAFSLGVSVEEEKVG